MVGTVGKQKRAGRESRRFLVLLGGLGWLT